MEISITELARMIERAGLGSKLSVMDMHNLHHELQEYMPGRDGIPTRLYSALTIGRIPAIKVHREMEKDAGRPYSLGASRDYIDSLIRANPGQWPQAEGSLNDPAE